VDTKLQHKLIEAEISIFKMTWGERAIFSTSD